MYQPLHYLCCSQTAGEQVMAAGIPSVVDARVSSAPAPPHRFVPGYRGLDVPGLGGGSGARLLRPRKLPSPAARSAGEMVVASLFPGGAARQAPTANPKRRCLSHRGDAWSRGCSLRLLGRSPTRSSPGARVLPAPAPGPHPDRPSSARRPLFQYSAPAGRVGANVRYRAMAPGSASSTHQGGNT
jgi:hypothetical protein